MRSCTDRFLEAGHSFYTSVLFTIFSQLLWGFFSSKHSTLFFLLFPRSIFLHRATHVYFVCTALVPFFKKF